MTTLPAADLLDEAFRGFPTEFPCLLVNSIWAPTPALPQPHPLFRKAGKTKPKIQSATQFPLQKAVFEIQRDIRDQQRLNKKGGIKIQARLTNTFREILHKVNPMTDLKRKI